ncbi:DUF4362 domain-containing protein [Paenibacillus polysaccharolyticus]|uniref:DUF4362 domain-containing protein n=1 Tax=Paenibacillus polysaccharolyticus TaxID=582692 RepID=UPI0012B8E909|nr:DUF4362 domain-containing protein [Paenibacillus xylanexedens]MDP9702310.1 hypothetical protein [Paenibacillus intestini]
MGKYFIMLCLAVVLATGCSPNDPQQTVDPVEKRSPFPAIVEPHNGEQAEESGDVVFLHGEMRNQEKWESFLQNVKKDQPDHVRVTMYTIEGDPIIHELIYDGTLFQSTYDATRDKYGSREEIMTNTCKGLELTKMERGESVYVLTNCEKQNSFYFPKM